MIRRQVIIAATLLVIGGGLGTLLRYTDRQPDREADFSRLPNEVGEYSGMELPIDRITLDVLQATATTERSYHDTSGFDYNLFLGYFKSQKFGSSIHSPKHCLPGGGWKILSQETVTVDLGQGLSQEANLLTISYLDQTSVMLYWFETRAGGTRSEYGLKFDQFTSALLFHPTDAAFIRVTVVVHDGDVNGATERCLTFAKEIYPHIADALPF